MNKKLLFLIAGLSLLVFGAGPAARAAAIDAPDGALIHLTRYTFDPLQGLPSLPRGMSLAGVEVTNTGTYLLQFSGAVLPEWKQAIVDAGGVLGSYIPDNAFIVHLDPAARQRVSALPFVRWVGAFQPAYKLSDPAATAALAAASPAPEAAAAPATRSYRVILAQWVDPATAAADLAGMGIPARVYDGGLTAVLTAAQVSAVSHLDGVTWLEPVYMIKAYNDVGGATIMRGSTAWAGGYTGTGVTVNITDTGLDTGDPATMTPEFKSRLAHISSWPVLYIDYGYGCNVTNAGANDGASDRDSGHGTHVAGSVTGSGANSAGQIKGLAYNANLTFQAVEQYTGLSQGCTDTYGAASGYMLSGIPDDVRQLLTEAYTWGARVQNDSWGGGDPGVYDQMANYFDDFIHSHADMTVTVSAGNGGTDANGDGYVDAGSVTSPGTAKNVITIGASDSERTGYGYSPYTWYDGWSSRFPLPPTASDRISSSRDHMAAFSSRGPALDGRIKPDLVAPGTDILSVRSSVASGTGWGLYSPNSHYMFDGGTSMASPLASGAAALVRDFLMHYRGAADPSAALIKALLINTAVDIPGYGNPLYEAGQPIPNVHEGWGRIDVGAATAKNGPDFFDVKSGVSTGKTVAYQVLARAGQPLKITLTWSDYQGAPNSSIALVNNLNLRVTSPTGVIYWGNQFSGGWSMPNGGYDSINNVEGVYIQNPDTSGMWKIEVIGQNVPVGPQGYALVYTGKLNLPYHMRLPLVQR